MLIERVLGDYPLKLTRAYRNADDQSRAFGIGTNDSLDIFLVGRMGSFIDLIGEDGGRLHFVHDTPRAGESGDVYRSQPGTSGGPEALFDGNIWHVTLGNGWTYLFPYRPHALGSHVTVLTGYLDPKGHKFEMARDESGDLLGVTTPTGKWLHFEHRPDHTIRRITDSQGRSVQYEYDSGGRLTRVSDSEGHSESYTYNDRNEMLSVSNDGAAALLTNQYTSTNLISKQTLSDRRHFEYSYTLGTRMVITQNLFTDPNGLLTYFDYGSNGYIQSLPSRPPQ
jgi:YD repeat-containing protein